MLPSDPNRDSLPHPQGDRPSAKGSWASKSNWPICPIFGRILAERPTSFWPNCGRFLAKPWQMLADFWPCRCLPPPPHRPTATPAVAVATPELHPHIPMSSDPPHLPRCSAGGPRICNFQPNIFPTLMIPKLPHQFPHFLFFTRVHPSAHTPQWCGRRRARRGGTPLARRHERITNIRSSAVYDRVLPT